MSFLSNKLKKMLEENGYKEKLEDYGDKSLDDLHKFLIEGIKGMINFE